MQYPLGKRSISVFFITFCIPLVCLYAKVNICYFSMNNEKEFTKMKEFTANLEKARMEKIVVTEYQKKGSDPTDSFKKMIDSGAKLGAP